MMTLTSKVESKIEKKIKAKELKEKGNASFKKNKRDEAEKFYTEALQLHPGCRPLYTNRAIVRNRMKKHEEAISDCNSGRSFKLMIT